jgi:hypothetical protein
MDLNRRIGIEHQTMGPPQTNRSFSPPFFSRLCFLKQQSENRQQIKINKQCTQDLQFLLFVLGKCHQSIDLNLIAFRQPTHVYRSDSCLAGLGGYSHKGFAWWFYLADELKFRASNNLLKHLAAIITLWIDIIAGCLKKATVHF